MTKLYHRDVFLPRRIRVSVPTGVIKLQYTQHAKDAARNDRYGAIPLSSEIDLGSFELIEVEHDGNKCTKFVAREVGQEKNRIFVMIPERGLAIVKTVWYNLASDKHATLKRWLYEQEKR